MLSLKQLRLTRSRFKWQVSQASLPHSVLQLAGATALSLRSGSITAHEHNAAGWHACPGGACSAAHRTGLCRRVRRARPLFAHGKASQPPECQRGTCDICTVLAVHELANFARHPRVGTIDAQHIRTSTSCWPGTQLAEPAAVAAFLGRTALELHWRTAGSRLPHSGFTGKW